MRWHRYVLLVLCVTCPASLLAQAPPAEAPPAAGDDAEKRKEEAKVRFQRGLELVQNESWDAALAEFLASRKLLPTRVALKNAALSLRQLKRNVESLAMYNELLTQFGTSIPPEERKTIDDAVAQLKQSVGEVSVESDQPGSNVIIDGQQQGTTPLAPVAVNAGTHSVRIVKEGFEAFEAQVLVAGGQREAIKGKLKALSAIGKLVVREAGGKVLDVVVDGAVVGKTPRYEGVVAVGPHTVFLKGEGNLGTAPSQANVKQNTAVTLTLSAVELDSEIRIEPVPANATVFVDGVEIGNGVWEGKLQSGSHQIEIAGEGFVPYRKAAVLTKGKKETLKVTLERDLSNPMWQAGFVPHLYAEVFGGVALAPLGLGGSADKACGNGDCSKKGFPLGFAAGARVGYQFIKGLSGELGFGFFYIGTKMTRKVTAAGENDVAFVSDDYEDETRFAAPFVELSAAYQLLEKKTPLTFRIGGGVARAKATFKNGGTFVGDVLQACPDPDNCDPESYTVEEKVSIAEKPYNPIVPFVAPEVRFGYRISKKFYLDFGVQVFLLLPPDVTRSGKPTGDEFSNLNRTEGQRRAALDDVPDAYSTPPTTARPGILSLDRETGFGLMVAFVPSIAAHFDF
ncbi:MAG TPA: PEGA domain-containing protein [Polyangiaceae bacterium]|nr:PEGA domain-containing protein [Polyangiaceae bacterium]